MTLEQKQTFMNQALKMANQCLITSDVPVGCVIIKYNKIIARGRNRREQLNVSTAHAEIEAINAACESLGSRRLDGCSIFITLEPCPMCAGAIALSNINEIYIGAMDFLNGACGSRLNIFDFNNSPPPKIEFGILKKDCKLILSEFFKKLRTN